LLAICAAVFLGAQASSIPYLLGKDRAKSAVAALSATEQAVNLIAPPLGGAIFGLVGALPALAANAATYLCSQVSIASVATFGPERPGGFPPLGDVVRDVRAGFSFVMHDPAMRTLTLNATALNTVGIFGFVAMIPYLKTEFGASDQLVGIAFGCFAVGSVCGALIAGRTHFPFGRALIVAYFADALAWLPTIWAPSIWLAVASVTVCAAFGAYEITSIVAWRMRVIPEEMIGRVFGVIRLLVLVGMFPGSLLGGALTDAFGPRRVMAISGICFLLLAASLAFSRASAVKSGKAGCVVVAPGGVSAGRSSRAVCIPASRAASSSASTSERKSIVLGATPVARAIAAYDDASRFAPIVVSKWSRKSGVRSPNAVCAKSTCCAVIEPDEYT
jgi:predicted MFS family arabinose efflux permease